MVGKEEDCTARAGAETLVAIAGFDDNRVNAQKALPERCGQGREDNVGQNSAVIDINLSFQ
jgi:hypothetical protein